MTSLLQDLRYGLRMLAKNPGFTAVAVLTLGLGIGANTAVFSLLHSTILERLPIKHPQELVQLTFHDFHRHGATGWTFNWPDYEPLLAPQPALPGLFANMSYEMNLRSGNVSDRVRTQLVSGAYYSTLGVAMLLGRSLAPTDDHPAAAPAAVLSYAYWGRRFGFDPGVIGRHIYLDGKGFSVVGVAPPGFYGLDRLSPPDVTCPLHVTPLQDENNYYVSFFARLEPGISIEQARAQLAARFQALLDTDLKSERGWMGRSKLDVAPAAGGGANVRWLLEEPLGVLTVLVVIVLLICCTNLATILLGRSAGRSREISVRLALGAGRWRIIRQLLTESILLGLAGGVAGLLVGSWVHRLLISLLGIQGSEVIRFRFELPVLAFTGVAALFTGIVFGLVPALHATRMSLSMVMKSEAHGTGHRRLGPTRSFLVVQIAASVLLLVGAALFVRTLRNLETMDVGFDRSHLLLMTVDPRQSRFQGDRLIGLFDELTERTRALPGIRAAALARKPLFGQSGVKQVWGQGPQLRGAAVGCDTVGPGFFATAAIPLLIGRDFTPRDRSGAPLVAIVNESFARQYFPGQNPIGRRFGDAGPNSANKYEIVGVVKDNRRLLRLAPQAAIFQSLWQDIAPVPFVLHVRVMGDVKTTAASVSREIQSIDPSLMVYDVRTMVEQMNGTLNRERTFAALSSLFSMLALALCCVGLYGIASYSVTHRTNEIGIRMALGAARSQIIWLFLRGTLILVVIGVAIGSCLALACAKFVKSLLFGLPPNDSDFCTRCNPCSGKRGNVRMSDSCTAGD